MTEEQIKIDMQKSLNLAMLPAKQKALEAERTKYQEDMKSWREENDNIAVRYSTFNTQVVSLEVAIVGAVIVFGLSHPTVWVVFAIFSFVLSIMLGISIQEMNIDSDFYFNRYEYDQRIRQNWWVRELWKDETVKFEKETIGKNRKEVPMDPRNPFLLKLLHLNADRLRNGFLFFFFLGLWLMVGQFLSGLKLIPG